MSGRVLHTGARKPVVVNNGGRPEQTCVTLGGGRSVDVRVEPYGHAIIEV
jgi:hypothetical protein